MNKKWAIRVPFEDSWLFITEGSIDDLRPVLYNTREAAESAAAIWTNYEVVEYEEDIL
jgi:glycerol-3-phosphate dehydrogenase